MKWAAPRNKLIVDIIKQDKMSEGGLLLPEGSSENPNGLGTVVVVHKNLGYIKKGDVVEFSKASGLLVGVRGGERYITLFEGEILAIHPRNLLRSLNEYSKMKWKQYFQKEEETNEEPNKGN